jgi:hypothetical protein
MTERTQWIRAIGVLGLTLSLLAPTAGHAQPVDPQRKAAAQKLYDQATAEMDAKNYASACPKLEEVERLRPDGLGAKLTTAQCYERLGRLASAWSKYTLLEELARKAGQAERATEAAKKAAELRPRLATLRIDVPAEVRALPGLAITRDGAPLGEAEWGSPVPVDKGQHVVVATRTGKPSWEKGVEIQADGEAVTVTIELPADIRTTTPPDTGTTTPPGTGTTTPPGTGTTTPLDTRTTTPLDTGTTTPLDARTTTPPPARDQVISPSPESLSHRFQPGAQARLDIDPLHAGVRTAVGLTLGLFDHVEVGASALIGPTMGFELQATVFMLTGAWKPLLNAGVPFFFNDLGPYVGIRTSWGVQWDVNRRFGVFAQVGSVYFPNAQVGYARTIFLPAAGVQGRI